MRKPGPRKPWLDDELAALAAIDPRERGAVKRHAQVFARDPAAVSTKLMVMRQRRRAPDLDARYTPRGHPFPNPKYRLG
jgi:hypothetical protein